MRAALIGAGFAGNMHAEALRACGVELAAVVTTREETARRFAGQWDIPVWGTSPELAYADGIDAVHICTPPSSHGIYAGEALRRGKHVFCEKPLCFDPDEADALAELAAKSGKICALTYNVRYHMAVERARELIRSGAFGRPILIHGSYLQEFHTLPSPYGWRYDSELSGKMRAVTEIGSHWIDTAQYVSGVKVEAVSAFFGNFFPERMLAGGMMTRIRPGEEVDPSSVLRVDSEDAACVMLKYSDGAIGSVMLSEVSPGRGNRLSLEVTCENGNLWWNEEENNVLHTARSGEGVHSEIFAFGNGFNDTFVALMRNFYRAVRLGDGLSAGGFTGNDQAAGENAADGAGDTGHPTFAEGAEIVKICEAIFASANDGSAWKEIGR